MTPKSTQMFTELPHRIVASIHEQTRAVSVGLVSLALVAALVGAFSGGVLAVPSSPGALSTPSSPGQSGGSGAGVDAQNATQTGTPYIVSDSIVVSGDKPLAPGQSDCGVANQFYRGQKAIFRIKVVDPQTGQQLNGSQLSGVTVHVTSGNGTTLKAAYGKHGTDHFWTAAWTVPDSFPSGKVNYSIGVTNGRAERVNFAVPESELTVLNKSVSDVQTSGSGGSGSGQPGPSQPTSLPIVFWAVVVVVAAVVVGLVWNAERQ